MKVDNILIENIQVLIEQITTRQKDIYLAKNIAELKTKLKRFETEIKYFVPAEKQPILELERVQDTQKQLEEDFEIFKELLETVKTKLEKVRSSQKQLSLDFESLKAKLLAENSDREKLTIAAKEVRDRENNHTSLVIPEEFAKISILLEQEKWEEADRETAKKMSEITAKEKGSEPNMLIDIDLFPAAKLIEIDRLWTHYSQERFGFSIQQKIWLELGGKLNNFDSEIYTIWVKKIGWEVNNYWKKYPELNFSSDAKLGHLPGVMLKWCDWGAAWCGMQTVKLFSKLD